MSKPFKIIVGLARDLEEDARQNRKQFEVRSLPGKSFEQIPPTYYQRNKRTWNGERQPQPSFPYNQEALPQTQPRETERIMEYITIVESLDI